MDVQPLSIEAVRSVLGGAGFRVAATTTSYADVADLVDAHKPDLLVLGVSSWSSGMKELECLEHARARHGTLKAIVVSDDDASAMINAAMRAGAVAYVTRAASVGDFATALRQVFKPSIYLASDRTRAAARQDGPAEEALTEREDEILVLVASGHSNSDIAKRLWITEQTVKFHLSNIYRKLGVANRTQAARKVFTRPAGRPR